MKKVNVGDTFTVHVKYKCVAVRDYHKKKSSPGLACWEAECLDCGSKIKISENKEWSSRNPQFVNRSLPRLVCWKCFDAALRSPSVFPPDFPLAFLYDPIPSDPDDDDFPY